MSTVQRPLPPNHDRAPFLRQTIGSKQLIVDGSPFLILGAEVHNSTFSSAECFESTLPSLKAMNINTVLAPVSWELIEPTEGYFQFQGLDKCILAARNQGLRLVLLWFGAYKNALSSYAPPWVRLDVKRFPRMYLRTDKGNLKITEGLQPYNEELIRADAKAFAALMAHVKEIDSPHHTVIMVQLENEVGLMFDSRDGSSKATHLYKNYVPIDLLRHLSQNYDSLHPAFRNKFSRLNLDCHRPVTWAQAFGGGPFAEDAFMADSFSRFCQKVATAGRAEYSIPIYMNVALCSEERDWVDSIPIPDFVPEGDVPGQFPSGGPVGHNLDIYRYNAPAIDFYGPDIYLQDYEKVCSCFGDGHQPLFIPEQRRDDYGARRIWSAIGNQQAIGCSPFGIDTLSKEDATIALHYKLLGSISEHILDAQATRPEDIFGFFFDENVSDDKHKSWNKTMGDYHVTINRAFVFGKPGSGAGMIIRQRNNSFLAAGYGFQVSFQSIKLDSIFTGILRATELKDDGRGGFSKGRTLNGDETHHGQVLIMPAESPDYGGFPIPALSPAGTMLAECVPYSLNESMENL